MYIYTYLAYQSYSFWLPQNRSRVTPPPRRGNFSDLQAPTQAERRSFAASQVQWRIQPGEASDVDSYGKWKITDIQWKMEDLLMNSR